jgi:hypothetical protein
MLRPVMKRRALRVVYPLRPAYRTIKTIIPETLQTPSPIPTPPKRNGFHFPSLAFSQRFPVSSVIVRLLASSVLGIVIVTGAILVHDATTYSERHVDRVPANALALHPRLGGKKNLPILEVNLDDSEDEEKRKMEDKPRMVIIGGGWGVSESCNIELTLRLLRYCNLYLQMRIT